MTSPRWLLRSLDGTSARCVYIQAANTAAESVKRNTIDPIGLISCLLLTTAYLYTPGWQHGLQQQQQLLLLLLCCR